MMRSAVARPGLRRWRQCSAAVLAWGCVALCAAADPLPGLRVQHSTVVVLEVGPQRQRCMGMFERMCLMVREVQPGTSPGRWLPWFEEIAGFDHVPGQRYVLRVRKDRLAQAPADVADTRYTLIEMLQAHPDRLAGGAP